MIGRPVANGQPSATAEDLIIRPIRPADREALLDGFDRMSADSRYRRFLSPHPHLSSRELRYFTEVDHHDHEALVAMDRASGQGVGVARYIRSAVEPTEAEFAVSVVDDWQGRGVGTRLMEALAERARQEGISKFTALVLAGNLPMLKLAGELGDVEILGDEQGTIELVVTLPDRGIGNVAALLQAIATGYLDALPLHRHHPRRDRAVPD